MLHGTAGQALVSKCCTKMDEKLNLTQAGITCPTKPTRTIQRPRLSGAQSANSFVNKQWYCAELMPVKYAFTAKTKAKKQRLDRATEAAETRSTTSPHFQSASRSDSITANSIVCKDVIAWTQSLPHALQRSLTVVKSQVSNRNDQNADKTT
jgi:hypothetical protein